MEKLLVYLFTILFLAGAVTAFPATLEVKEREAAFDDPARFQVIAENNFAEKRNFRISSLRSASGTSSWISHDYSESVEPGEKARLNITVEPPENAIQNNYGFTVNVRTLKGDRREQFRNYFTVNNRFDLKITDSGLNDTGYRPGSIINPHLTLMNTAPRDIGDYSVKASFKSQNFTRKGDLISPGSERTYRFNIEVPEMRPGDENLTLYVLREGVRTRKTSEKISIEEIKDIERSVAEEERFLSFTKKFSVKNNGNAPVEVEINETLPVYLEPVTVFSSEPSEIKELDGEKKYSWERRLEPGESVKLEYQTRYWPPLVVVAAIFGGFLVLKRYYTGIGFQKRAKKVEDGVKIHHEIHNNSSSKIQRIELKDFVPDVASVGKEFPMANPVIRKTSNGTKLNWEIEEMEPGEQRVFEYTITPLVEVEGGIVLPEAELEVDERRVSKTEKVEVEFSPE